MEKLEIKDNILHIDDGQKYYQITLNAIDIACTDGFVINLKLYDGKQAFLHPENKESREEFSLCFFPVKSQKNSRLLLPFGHNLLFSSNNIHKG